MGRPLLVTTPLSQRERPILIIDKQGIIGSGLTNALKLSSLPILISKRVPSDQAGMLFIPYGNRFPRLPQNSYSHIVVVYQGEKELEKLLARLARKAADMAARFILVVPQRLLTTSLSETVTRHNGTLFITGDLFGQEEIASPVSTLVTQAKQEKRVVLSEMGLQLRYPLAIADLIHLIVDCIYRDPPSHLFLAAYPPRTELSLVRLLQQIDPMIVMDFTREKRQSNLPPLPGGVVTLTPLPELLEKHLREILTDPSSGASPIRPKRQKKKSSRKGLKEGVTVALFLVLMPFLVSLLGAIVGFGCLGLSGLFLQRGDVMTSSTFAKCSQGSFSVAEPSEMLITDVFRMAGVPFPTRVLSSSVSEGKTAADLFVTITSIAQDMIAVSHGKALPPETIKLDLKKAALSYQSLEAQEILPAAYREKLKKDESLISLITNFIDVSPQLLGFDKDQQYAVLFQNNMELRPGGGFIGSFATFTMQQGALKDLVVSDVYDADGQLKGHIDPPYPLRRYLGAAHWFLRDSNFSLDSAVNATTAAQFLSLETDKHVDGVISVDLSFFKMLLGVTGPLYLPDYKTTVTQDTLFQQIESHVEDNFFPGSTQKKDFLSSLLSQLLSTLSAKKVSPLSLARVVAEAIAQKHLLATSLSPQIQPLFVQNKLVSNPAYVMTPDILGISESNVGANKANYFIKRSVLHQVHLREDATASESVTLSYFNTSNGEKFGGAYSAYIELIVPKGSKLSGITINDTDQKLVPAVTDPAVYTSSTFKEPKGLEVTDQSEDGKEVFGFPLHVQEGEMRKVTVSYTTPHVLVDKPSSYTLTYFKQPGRESDPYTLDLSYPHSWKTQSSPPSVEKKSDEVLLQRTILEDQIFTFSFRQ